MLFLGSGDGIGLVADKVKGKSKVKKSVTGIIKL